MPLNDPTDNGGLFIGRRPGTAPFRFTDKHVRAGERRQAVDGFLATGLLVLEFTVLATILVQPLGWLWVGGRVAGETGVLELGLVASLAGTLASMLLTLALALRIDHAWKLTKRASGVEQQRGMVEWLFVVVVVLGMAAFCFWLTVLTGPGSPLYGA